MPGFGTSFLMGSERDRAKTMMRIGICDDEKEIRSYLASLVREQNVECEIAEYASPGEYLSDPGECDLLFLDIGMDKVTSGMDGMDLARRIRSMEQIRQPVIIFVTGYEKYVYEAFDVEAFHYLVKPVDEGKFAEVFRRAVEQSLTGQNPSGGELCQEYFSETQKQKKTLLVQLGKTSKALPLDSLYYMESQGHKILLHIKGGTLEYYARISALEEELQGLFFRIHKGYLVNLACVEEYSRTEVKLVNGNRLPLSKYKYEAFVKAYLRFLQS